MPKTELISTRLTSYIQNTWDLKFKNAASMMVTAGLRSNYSTLNRQFLLSPRASMSYKPNWKKDILFRFATGIYYQPPLLREYVDPYGEVRGVPMKFSPVPSCHGVTFGTEFLKRRSPGDQQAHVFR